jgi:outer membrane protein OmpA-like peptidoglycan-associated protein
VPEVAAVPKLPPIPKPAGKTKVTAEPVPAVAAIAAPKPIAIPIPAVTKAAVPKAAETKIVAPSKAAIPQPPKVTAAVPAPPKASAAVPQVPVVAERIPKAPSPPAESVVPKAGDSAIAALTTTVDVSDEGNKLRILFEEESSNLPGDAAAALEQLAKKMTNDRSLRLLIHGFASDTSNTPSKVRRLSLFRALAVRTQLMSYGVRSTRMQLRALGNRNGEGPPDRVDVVVAN